jgi:hypothetical protein
MPHESSKKKTSRGQKIPKRYVDPSTGETKDIEEHPEYRYKVQDDPKYKGADKETQNFLKTNRTKFDDPMDLAKGVRAFKAAIKFAQKHGWNTSAEGAAKNTRAKKENIDRALERSKRISINWGKGQWEYKDKDGEVNGWKMPIFSASRLKEDERRRRNATGKGKDTDYAKDIGPVK